MARTRSAARVVGGTALACLLVLVGACSDSDDEGSDSTTTVTTAATTDPASDPLSSFAVPSDAERPELPELDAAGLEPSFSASEESFASLETAVEQAPARGAEIEGTPIDPLNGVALEIPPTWSEYGRDDTWAGLYSPGTEAEAEDLFVFSNVDFLVFDLGENDFTASALANSSAQATIERMELTGAVVEDYADVPADQLPAGTRSAASAYWHDDTFEGLQVVFVQEDGRIILFATLNALGYWDRWVGEYGFMLDSVTVDGQPLL